MTGATGQSFDQWTRTAMAARQLGDADQCLEILREGLEQDRASPARHLFAGECYAALGFYLESLQCYDTAARLAPAGSVTLIEALLCGAVLLTETGFYEEAATRFESVRALDQPESELSGRRGTSRAERNQLAVELAQLAARIGRIEQPGVVKDLLERSLALRDTPEARFELARQSLANGEAGRALEHLEQGRRLDGTNPGFQNLAARCYMALGQVKSARDALLRAELLGDRSRSGRVLRLESKSWPTQGSGRTQDNDANPT